jgi:hypothetical protein
MMRRNTMLSAGEGSYRAAVIDRRRYPDAQHRYVFTDTLYEDADAYRFLIEGAAHITGRRLNWSVRAEDFPDYRVLENVPIEEYRGNPEWRAFLADLRLRTMDAIPELIWLVEGRDVWEVFRDRLFLGNSGVDPCSEALKRLCFADWRSANCYRVGELFGPPDVFLVGIGDHEPHRFYGDAKSVGILRANAKDGWLYEAPLLTEPMPGEYDLFWGPLDRIGPAEPRLYGMGYSHNNCGGFCCKAGQAHYANRFRVQPERFAYDAMMERKVVAYLGGGYAMLTDRRGGGKKPMTLDTFAERLRAEPDAEYVVQPGESGCGCMGVAA